MKNNFDDILNQQGTNEVTPKEETPVVTPESKGVSEDPLAKFKKHRNHKKNRIKVVAVEEFQETPSEEEVVEPKPVNENIMAVSLDLSSIEDAKDAPEVEVAATSEELEEAVSEDATTNSFKSEPAEIIEISTPPKKEPKKYQLKKVVIKEKREKEVESEPESVLEQVSETVVPVTDPPIVESEYEPVLVPSTKKKFLQTAKIWNKLTFNKDYKRLVPVLIGASMLIVVLLVAMSIRTGLEIPTKSNLVANAAIAPQNDQVSVNKDENLLLMEKAVNEGLPVNHYILAAQYNGLLKETEYPKQGYVLIGNLLVQASPEVVNTYTVNGREYAATAVLTTWAVKSNGSSAISKEDLPSIKVAIETAFHNKDKEFFEDETATLEILSFAIERVTGQQFEIEKVILKGDFK